MAKRKQAMPDAVPPESVAPTFEAGEGGAASLPAVSRRDELAAMGMFERDPADLAEATEWVLERIQRGRLAASEIAVLLSHVRDHRFAEDVGGWLVWVHEEFGYERSFAYTCHRVGRKLRSPFVRSVVALLARQDITKLDVLTQVPDEQLAPLLARWDPSNASRAEVRRKIALLGWSGEEMETCSKCGEEYRPADGDEDGGGCPACAKAAATRAKPAPPDPVAQFERLVLDLRNRMGSDRASALAACDGMGTARAGAELILLTLDSQRRAGDWAEEDHARLLVVVESLRERVLDVAAAKGLTRGQVEAAAERIARGVAAGGSGKEQR